MALTTQKEIGVWNRIAEKYSKSPVTDQAAYEKKLAMTQEYLTPQSTVFEFGCGTGSTALVHAPLVAHIDAIDVAENMIAIAKQKAAKAGVTNIDFRQGDIHSVDVSGPYDVILGMSILHLLRDRPAVLAKVNRLLRPGGYFITSTVCMSGLIGLLLPVLTVGRWLGRMPYVTGFTKAQLCEEIESASFCIEQEWQPKKNAAVFLMAKKV